MAKRGKHSYFEQRMKALGVTAKNNEVKSPNYQGAFGQSKIDAKEPYLVSQVFSQDEDGNILIQYHTLQGRRFSWRKPGTKNVRNYFRKRLKDPIVQKKEDGKEDKIKYLQEKGSGQFPFLTPSLIDKYLEKKEIDTLWMVEGEFKAYAGYLKGIDILGLPSIHGFYNGDIRGKLHEWIQELVIGCQVKNVAFLTDADTVSVKWDKDKDLYNRPNSFYLAIKYFRESLELLLNDQGVPLANIYWSHIDDRFMESAKGLDDLFEAFPDKTKEILSDLQQFQFAKKYFRGEILTDSKFYQRVLSHFGLKNEQDFYQIYKKFIGNKEFLFRKRRYEFDGEKVKYVRHEDADKFMRIGADWLKVVGVPNKYGELEEDIVPWKISEIIRDYQKRYPDFLDQIPKYDAFCNMPSWNGTYKRVHNDCYNLCNPISHDPRDGEFPVTKKFLLHLFGAEGEGSFEKNIEGDAFTVALDYLTIQYQRPIHMLPVPILVSKDNNTGKSTFLKWLQTIYGSGNVAILNNEQFKMKFNAHYITKFIIGIDESFLDVDKKTEKERLKQLVSSDYAYLEHKGQNVKKFPYYGKLILCSNDADRVMKIDPEDSRWFVVSVPPIKKEDKDPDMEQKLKAEIPAWLHYLKNRKIFHKRIDRFWFKKEWFETEQFRIIVEATKNRVDRIFEAFIKEQFLMFRRPVLRYGMPQLLERLNDPKVSKYRMDETELKYYLKERRGMDPENVQRIKIPVKYNVAQLTFDGKPELIEDSVVARPYKFLHTDWLNDKEMEEFNSEHNPNLSIEEGENKMKKSEDDDKDTLPF